MTTLQSLLIYSFIVLLFYYAFVSSFRLLLHPLRKYPGPFLANLSNVYGGFFAFRKRLHLQTYKNHLKYGSVVRQAPNRLVFNTITALQDIYQNDAIAKSHVYAVAQPDQHNIFTTTDKNEHKPKRRLISQILSDHSMRTFESTMVDQINVFLKQVIASKSSPFNMTPACRYLGLNIAGHLGFGYELDLQTDETHRYLTDAITFGNYRVNTTMQFTPLARLKLGPIMDLFPNSLRTKLMSTLAKMITSRLSIPTNAKHDLLSVFATQSDVDVKNFKQQSIWTEAIFFFAAGGETVASALAAVFFYLSHNSNCYETLAKEIRTAFQAGDEIRGGQRLSDCRYLRACIDEALRMSPPVPGTLWREAAPGCTPLVVDGHVIPAGTQVGVSIYSLHHNEEYFPAPFKFDPERWLSGTSSRRANQSAFSPFSIGSRGCAGKSMAYLELSLVLAKTMWYFDFHRAPLAAETGTGAGISGVTHAEHTEDEFPIFDLFAANHNGPILEFAPRGSFCDELGKL